MIFFKKGETHKRYGFHSIAIRFPLLGIFVIGLSLSLLACLLYNNRRINLQKSISRELIGIAVTGTLLIDPDEHEDIFLLENDEIEKKESFQHLKDILLKIQKENHLKKAVYTLRKAPDFEKSHDMEFVVMTDLGPDGKSYTGNRIAMSKYVEEVYQTGHAVTTPPDINNTLQGLKSHLFNTNASIRNIDSNSFNSILTYMKKLKQSDQKWAVVLSFFDEANELFAKNRTKAFQSFFECERIVDQIAGIISAQQRHAKADITKELLDINVALVNTTNMYKTSLENKKIKLEMKLTQNMPKLFLNEGELERIFGNMIKNAIDAMSDITGRDLKLVIESELTHNSINVKIADTGCGIKEKDLPNIFRSDFTTKADGIGLSFCMDFMKRNEGKIYVKSVEGEGTEFLLVFNLNKDRENLG